MGPEAIEVIRLRVVPDFQQVRAVQLSRVDELAARPERRACLMLLQHQPVYTLGRSTKPEHLPLPAADLAQTTGAEVTACDRGGSVTYHGPGQLTAYVILHLKAWNLTIHQHLWNLEEIAIQAAARFHVRAIRQEGMTGAWAEDPKGRLCKFCAIGVGCRRWVTYHGLGLNVDLNLAPFLRIDPCGLGRPVGSLRLLAQRAITMQEAEDAVIDGTRSVLCRGG